MDIGIYETHLGVNQLCYQHISQKYQVEAERKLNFSLKLN